MDIETGSNTPVSNSRRTSVGSLRVTDISLKQFLNYLQLLKEGESVLRTQIEKDEEIALQKLARRKNSKTSRSPEKRLSVSNTLETCTVKRIPSCRRMSIKKCDTSAINNSYSMEKSTNFRRQSLSSTNTSPIHRVSHTLHSSSEVYVNGRMSPRLTLSPDSYFWMSPVYTDDLPRESVGSANSVFVSHKSNRDREQHNQSMTCPSNPKYPSNFRLPRITFSTDDDVFLSPNQNLKQTFTSTQQYESMSGRQPRSRETLSTSPPRSKSHNTRQTERHVVHHKTVLKENTETKEAIIPCEFDCHICYENGLPGPLRVCFSTSCQTRKTAYLEGILDGRGNLAWPISRKKEIQGLVYNRQSHSFHPPLSRKWSR